VLIGRIELILKKPKISRPIQNFLMKYDDIISKGNSNIRRMSVIKYKINLVYSFSIMARQTFNSIMQRKIKKRD